MIGGSNKKVLACSVRLIFLAFLLLQSACVAVDVRALFNSKVAVLENTAFKNSDAKPVAQRWLFLGDSITQAGAYVDIIEATLLLSERQAPEIIDLGLMSETVSGLSEPDHSFPRPYLHNRLTALLEQVQADRVFACYGMNDAIYAPFSDANFAAYQRGIKQLIKTVQASGASLTLITPPPYARLVQAMPESKTKRKGEDDVENVDKDVDKNMDNNMDNNSAAQHYSYKAAFKYYDQVLARYAYWLLSMEDEADITVIDIRPELTKLMTQSYTVDPIHPNTFGHNIIAKAILQSLTYDGVTSSKAINDIAISNVENYDSLWIKLLALVRQQRKAYDWVLLNDIGHGNPFVAKAERVTLTEAEIKAADINDDIERLLNTVN